MIRIGCVAIVVGFTAIWCAALGLGAVLLVKFIITGGVSG
jgi:hypothetical protein